MQLLFSCWILVIESVKEKCCLPYQWTKDVAAIKPSHYRHPQGWALRELGMETERLLPSLSHHSHPYPDRALWGDCNGEKMNTGPGWGSPCVTSGQESACQSRRPLIPGSGRSPGGGHSNPLQFSCLENLMDRGAWRTTVHGVSKSWTQLSYWAYCQMKKSIRNAPGSSGSWRMRYWLSCECETILGDDTHFL